MRNNKVQKRRSRFPERRNIVSKEDAQKILEKYLPGLWEDFQAAWQWVQDILDQDPERRSTFDSSAQAAMIFLRLSVLAVRRLYGQPGIQIKKHGRMVKITFDGRLSLRFKKFGDGVYGANIHTNTQMYMYYQFEFEGMESPTEVTFGYKTDAAGRNVTGVYITCPIGWRVNKWIITLADEENGMLPFVSPQPHEPVPGDAQVKITVKKAEGQ
jgi:hypothetical protein